MGWGEVGKWWRVKGWSERGGWVGGCWLSQEDSNLLEIGRFALLGLGLS